MKPKLLKRVLGVSWGRHGWGVSLKAFLDDDYWHPLNGYVLADLRSAPYSSYRQEFNYRSLKKILPEQGIQYVFLGRELGAQR